MNYELTYIIEVDADTPQEAAQMARDMVCDPRSRCHVWVARDEQGRETSVDLDDIVGSIEAQS